MSDRSYTPASRGPASVSSYGSNGPVVAHIGEELGTARWTTPEELRARFTFDGSRFAINDDYLWEGCSNGQVWLGETVDPVSAPIGYADDRHVCLVSGSRGGKGTSVIIPNLCFWPGSCFVIDPKGENANVTARRRGAGSDYCYGLGQAVYILDPFGEVQLDASLKGRFNPLDAIDPLGDFAVDDAGRIAASLVVGEGNQSDRFFEDSALNLIKGLILHVLTDADFEGRRNLVTVWRLVNQGHWLVVETLRNAGRDNLPSPFAMLWASMKRSTHYNGLIAGLGDEMETMSERTRDSIRKTAATHLDFIGGAPMQRVLEKSDFNLEDIKTKPRGVTVYLTLPQRYMKTHFRWLRLMTDLAVGEMERVKGRPATGSPTLFVLDEFAGLKRMEVIEHAAAQAAGFGAKFFFVVQSLVQLKDVYKDSWETFLGNAGLKLFFNIEDDFTRQYLSRQLGEREVRRQTQTSSQTKAEGSSTTDGRSTTTTTGSSTSTTTGQSSGDSFSQTEGTSTGWSSGGSSGASSSFDPHGLIFKGKHTGDSFSGGQNWSETVGSNWSTSTGRNSTYSESLAQSQQTSEAAGTSTSLGRSITNSITAGWSDTVHKRLLLNPDEIGRFFAPISNQNDPSAPGLVGALVIGEHPILLRRVNYFQSARFAGFYDPHPDHKPPLTLAELSELARPKFDKVRMSDYNIAPDRLSSIDNSFTYKATEEGIPKWLMASYAVFTLVVLLAIVAVSIHFSSPPAPAQTAQISISTIPDCGPGKWFLNSACEGLQRPVTSKKNDPNCMRVIGFRSQHPDLCPIPRDTSVPDCYYMASASGTSKSCSN